MASAGGSLLVRLAKRRQARRRTHAAEGEGTEVPPNETEDERDEIALAEVVEHFRLGRFISALEGLGVEGLDDFSYLQDSDLEKLGMPMILRRKLMEAVGSDWRSSQEIAAEMPPKQKALETHALPLVKEEVQVSDSGLDSISQQAEFKQLLEKVGDCVEDFAMANNLDAKAKSIITSLPPKVALRTIGLVGRGNSFLMHGVRQPGAAVLSRSRIAGDEEASGRGGMPSPYEDWEKLLDAFAQVNALPEETRQMLQNLTREQALRVLGFTSGLRFVVPLEVAEPDAEVSSRISLVLSGDSMVPVVSRSAGRPPIISRRLPTRSIPNSRGPLPAKPATMMVLPGAMAARGGLPMGRRSSRSSSRRQRSRSPRRQRSRSPLPHSGRHGHGGHGHGGHHSHGGGGFKGKGKGGASTMPAPSFAPGEDSAPQWQHNREAFVQLNNLSERCADALLEAEKTVVLQVMGLLGHENSFVIRGVRNPSAAVMNRLKKANAGGFGNEPYARLPGLVEDFIAMNDFDTRGQEVTRTLRPEVALHVMGFTAENAFIIEGVRNVSAALMARVAVAQRVHPH